MTCTSCISVSGYMFVGRDFNVEQGRAGVVWNEKWRVCTCVVTLSWDRHNKRLTVQVENRGQGDKVKTSEMSSLLNSKALQVTCISPSMSQWPLRFNMPQAEPGNSFSARWEPAPHLVFFIWFITQAQVHRSLPSTCQSSHLLNITDSISPFYPHFQSQCLCG